MKKFLILFVLGLFSSLAFAQQFVQHMKVKGVEINGTPEEFVEKMKQKGFEFFEKDSAMIVMTGKFAQFEKTMMVIPVQKDFQNVYMVSVIIVIEQQDWKSVYDTYDLVDSMLKEKYGQPISVKRSRSNGFPGNDEEKFRCVMSGACKYSSYYECKQGGVQVSVLPIEYLLGVELKYFDKANGDAYSQQYLQDL